MGDVHAVFQEQLARNTHRVAVHEENPKRLAALILQTQEEGIMSIQVVGPLQAQNMKSHMTAWGFWVDPASQAPFRLLGFIL